MEEKGALIDAVRCFRQANMKSEVLYCCNKYKELYGEDEDYQRMKYYDKVLVVGIDCDEEFGSFMEGQTYKNVEFLSMQCSVDFFDKLSEYLNKSTCQYVTFLEKNQRAKPQKIDYLLQVLYLHDDISAALCTSNIVDEKGEMIAHPDFTVTGICKRRCVGLSNQCYSGKNILRYCLAEEDNVLGTLSNILVKKEYIQQCIPLKVNYEPIWSTVVLYNLILNCNIMIAAEPMIDVLVSPYDKDIVETKQRAFAEFISNEVARELKLNIVDCEHLGLPLCYTEEKTLCSEDRGLEKKMTFYYTDKGEYYNLQPLADEAKRRGYEVTMTTDTDAESEIGFYCQHCSDPKNAKFSVILLHDMEQGHTMHPNLWWWERWDVFDIGILPGPAWRERWESCAGFSYANTRKGVFDLGYPKSDYVHSEEILSRAQQLKQDMGFKYDQTILYAPSWENDGKEDEFICALQSMKVNLLIKQASWPDTYAHIIKNINDQRQLHEGKYDNVYYVEPEESILVALAMSDMVVSDESSVMTEALMFGIPSLAVTDWLIPDTTPSRCASVPMQYVFKCEKKEIRTWVEKILKEEQYQELVTKNCNHIFANVGNCCREILDCVEYYTVGAKQNGFQRHRLHPKYMPSGLWY